MSAYDLTDCPSDPVESARERIRNLLVRDPMPDPRATPARTESATIWGLKRIAGLAVIVALIWAGLHIA